MSDIIGLGLSHYPGPLVPPEHWTNMLRRNVEVGRIAPELFADPTRWPAAMREEWGTDEGIAAAHAHAARLAAGYAALRQALDSWAPDLVVIWGDDQYENFRKDCIPPFCVYVFDELVSRPFGGGRRLFKTETSAWGVPLDTPYPIRGHAGAAGALCRALLEGGFDVAYATETRAEAGLAHSFNNTALFLDPERRGFPYPVVPFHVNCYGNQLLEFAAIVEQRRTAPLRTPPAPSPRRCFEIGRATARYFAESPWRVALIASSSWSHASLTPKHGRLYPDSAADRALLDDLVSGRFTRWGDIPLKRIEDAGQHEVLNWICLAGAMTELGHAARVVDYVESNVFNSAKCFALFPSPDTA